MRGQRTLLVWLLILLVLVGCRTSPEPFLRPPKPGEDMAGVPPNDPRYTNPPQYPAAAMKSSGKKGNNANPPGGPGGPGGMGSGMGGMRTPGISGPGMSR